MMNRQKEPLRVPRHAPVYASNGVNIGTVSGLGIQFLRIRRGRFFPRYLDVPASLVARVEQGRVWLSRTDGEVVALGRLVPRADAPEERLVGEDEDVPAFTIPFEAPVYASDGAKIGAVADATRTTIDVREGFPLASHLALPISVIDRVEGERVYLTIPADDAKRIGTGQPEPLRSPRAAPPPEAPGRYPP